MDLPLLTTMEEIINESLDRSPKWISGCSTLISGSDRPSHLPDLSLLHLDGGNGSAHAAGQTWGSGAWHRLKGETRQVGAEG